MNRMRALLARFGNLFHQERLDRELDAELAAHLESLFYQVKPTDIGILAFPAMAIFAAALLASFPPLLRAVRVDPMVALRYE